MHLNSLWIESLSILIVISAASRVWSRVFHREEEEKDTEGHFGPGDSSGEAFEGEDPRSFHTTRVILPDGGE